MPNIHGDMWGRPAEVRAVFSWLTRHGFAPAFGSRPVGWYQQDQMDALDVLTSIYRASKQPGDSHGFRIEVRSIKKVPVVIAISHSGPSTNQHPTILGKLSELREMAHRRQRGRS